MEIISFIEKDNVAPKMINVLNLFSNIIGRKFFIIGAICKGRTFVGVIPGRRISIMIEAEIDAIIAPSNLLNIYPKITPIRERVAVEIIIKIKIELALRRRSAFKKNNDIVKRITT